MIRIVEFGGLFTGAFGLMAQQIPIVPDDFKSFPVTALLAFIVVVTQFLKTYETKTSLKSLDRLSDKIGVMSEELATTNNKTAEGHVLQAELNSKLGSIATGQATTNTELKGFKEEMASRPCWTGKPISKA